MIQTNLQLLKPYEFEFSKPQFNHFSKFIQCLQVCDKPTINRFYHLHNTDRSSMNRFLTESPWKLEDLENIHLNQISKYYKEGSSMLIDDTISHRKYAKKVEGANYHFNHTESKQSLGYCILTSTISFDNQILPYIIKPYYRKDDCVNTTFKSKNEMAKEIILSSKNQEKIKYVIFDTWFSNDIVIGACKSAGKNYITQIKSNRNITIDNKKRFVREHAREIKDEDWFEFAVEGNKLRIVNTSAFISKIGSIQKYIQHANLCAQFKISHFLLTGIG